MVRVDDAGVDEQRARTFRCPRNCEAHTFKLAATAGTVTRLTTHPRRTFQSSRRLLEARRGAATTAAATVRRLDSRPRRDHRGSVFRHRTTPPPPPPPPTATSAAANSTRHREQTGGVAGTAHSRSSRRWHPAVSTAPAAGSRQPAAGGDEDNAGGLRGRGGRSGPGAVLPPPARAAFQRGFQRATARNSLLRHTYL